MQFQTYQEKMDMILKQLSVMPNSNSLTLTTPISSLSFDEFHKILSHDNVIVIDMPAALFNFCTMKVSYSGMNPAMANLSAHDPYELAMCTKVEVSTFKTLDITEFYQELEDENTIFFFYTGQKVCDQYNLRYGKLSLSIIKPAVDRFEAIQRINSIMNLNSSVKEIRDYVKSRQFSLEMALAKTDMNEIVKELNKNMNEEQQEQRRIDTFDITSGLHSFPHSFPNFND